MVTLKKIKCNRYKPHKYWVYRLSVTLLHLNRPILKYFIYKYIINNKIHIFIKLPKHTSIRKKGVEV